MSNNKIVLLISCFMCIVDCACASDPFVITGTNLSLNEVVQNIGNASTIIVGALNTNVSMVVYNGLDTSLLAGKNLKIIGDTWVDVSSDYESNGGVTFGSIDGYDFLHFRVIGDKDPFKFIKNPLNGNTISLGWERTINYGEALNNPSGYFLNYLRVNGKDNKLISKLDGASNITEFNNIMDKSIRLHPILLMRSVREVNMVAITDTVRHNHGIGLGVEPVYMFSNSSSSVGGNLWVDFEVADGLFIQASGYGYGMKYSDDVNNYQNSVYGGNVRIDYFSDVVFVRSVLGANVAMFNTGPVLNGNGVVDNPNGFGLYGYADVGKTFVVMNELSLSPFVGFGGDRLSILDEKESNGFGRAGLDVGYKFDLDGLRQEYTLRAAVNTNGYFDASLNFDVWSNVDSVGVKLSVGIIQTENATSGKVSGKFKFAF